MINRRELLKNLGLLTGLSTLPINELLAHDETVIKNKVVSNYEAANAFYLGVNLGQAEVFAMKGQYYNFIEKTIKRAKYHAGLIPQLAGMGQKFDDLYAAWSGNGNTIISGLQVSVDSLKDQIVARMPYVNVLYTGFRLGNSEAGIAIGGDDNKDWVLKQGLPEAIGNAKSAGLWTNSASLIGWAASCQDTSYFFKAIEGARRLLYEELIGPQSKLRVRAANVELPIGSYVLKDDSGNAVKDAIGNDVYIKQQVYDPVFARAVVINDGKKRLAMVSVDATYIYDEDYHHVKNRVQALTSIDTFILGATHDHHPTYASGDAYRNAIADAIIIAAGDLVEAEMGIASGEAYEGFSRVVRTDSQAKPPLRTSTTQWSWPVDESQRPAYLASRKLDVVNNKISILHFRNALPEKETGVKESIATVVNYAAHAIVLALADPNISADYPGEVVKFVVDKLGGECLFLQGAAGDIDPWNGGLVYEDKDPNAAEKYPAKAEMKRMASSIGGSVYAQIQSITDYTTKLSIAVKQVSVKLTNFTTVNDFKRDSALVTTVLLDKDIALLAVPGEFFTSLGLYLKRKSPCSKTFFIGYANDTIVYVPSKADWHTGGYGTTPDTILDPEACRKDPANGCKTDWCGIAYGAGESILDAAIDSIKDMLKNYSSPRK